MHPLATLSALPGVNLGYNLAMSESHWPDILLPPHPAHIQDLLDSFWTELAVLADLLPRRQFLLAAEQLHSLRQVILHLMLALNGIQRPATRDLNTYLSANQRAVLEKSLLLPSVDYPAWIDTLIGQAVSLVVIYRWYAPQLVAKHNLRYPRAQEQAAWVTLVENLPSWPQSITSE
jgi:hypothetical protein